MWQSKLDEGRRWGRWIEKRPRQAGRLERRVHKWISAIYASQRGKRRGGSWGEGEQNGVKGKESAEKVHSSPQSPLLLAPLFILDAAARTVAAAGGGHWSLLLLLLLLLEHKRGRDKRRRRNCWPDYNTLLPQQNTWKSAQIREKRKEGVGVWLSW